MTYYCFVLVHSILQRIGMNNAWAHHNISGYHSRSCSDYVSSCAGVVGCERLCSCLSCARWRYPFLPVDLPRACDTPLGYVFCLLCAFGREETSRENSGRWGAGGSIAIWCTGYEIRHRNLTYIAFVLPKWRSWLSLLRRPARA